jgi:hypothetical protein
MTQSLDINSPARATSPGATPLSPSTNERLFIPPFMNHRGFQVRSSVTFLVFQRLYPEEMDHNANPFQMSIAEFSLESGTIG